MDALLGGNVMDYGRRAGHELRERLTLSPTAVAIDGVDFSSALKTVPNTEFTAYGPHPSLTIPADVKCDVVWLLPDARAREIGCINLRWHGLRATSFGGRMLRIHQSADPPQCAHLVYLERLPNEEVNAAAASTLTLYTECVGVVSPKVNGVDYSTMGRRVHVYGDYIVERYILLDKRALTDGIVEEKFNLLWLTCLCFHVIDDTLTLRDDCDELLTMWIGSYFIDECDTSGDVFPFCLSSRGYKQFDEYGVEMAPCVFSDDAYDVNRRAGGVLVATQLMATGLNFVLTRGPLHGDETLFTLRKLHVHGILRDGVMVDRCTSMLWLYVHAFGANPWVLKELRNISTQYPSLISVAGREVSQWNVNATSVGITLLHLGDAFEEFSPFCAELFTCEVRANEPSLGCRLIFSLLLREHRFSGAGTELRHRAILAFVGASYTRGPYFPHHLRIGPQDTSHVATIVDGAPYRHIIAEVMRGNVGYHAPPTLVAREKAQAHAILRYLGALHPNRGAGVDIPCFGALPPDDLSPIHDNEVIGTAGERRVRGRVRVSRKKSALIAYLCAKLYATQRGYVPQSEELTALATMGSAGHREEPGRAARVIQAVNPLLLMFDSLLTYLYKISQETGDFVKLLFKDTEGVQSRYRQREVLTHMRYDAQNRPLFCFYQYDGKNMQSGVNKEQMALLIDMFLEFDPRGKYDLTYLLSTFGGYDRAELTDAVLKRILLSSYNGNSMLASTRRVALNTLGTGELSMTFVENTVFLNSGALNTTQANTLVAVFHALAMRKAFERDPDVELVRSYHQGDDLVVVGRLRNGYGKLSVIESAQWYAAVCHRITRVGISLAEAAGTPAEVNKTITGPTTMLLRYYFGDGTMVPPVGVLGRLYQAERDEIFQGVPSLLSRFYSTFALAQTVGFNHLILMPMCMLAYQAIRKVPSLVYPHCAVTLPCTSGIPRTRVFMSLGLLFLASFGRSILADASVRSSAFFLPLVLLTRFTPPERPAQVFYPVLAVSIPGSQTLMWHMDGGHSQRVFVGDSSQCNAYLLSHPGISRFYRRQMAMYRAFKQRAGSDVRAPAPSLLSVVDDPVPMDPRELADYMEQRPFVQDLAAELAKASLISGFRRCFRAPTVIRSALSTIFGCMTNCVYNNWMIFASETVTHENARLSPDVVRLLQALPPPGHPSRHAFLEAIRTVYNQQAYGAVLQTAADLRTGNFMNECGLLDTDGNQLDPSCSAVGAVEYDGTTLVVRGDGLN
uniref:RNA-dependent RNA polymerase n=1 Tax=Leptomonas pyrrhocoris ostravirus TaxID=3070843 RepID=A0AA50Q9G0_9VIRU|nr:putative RNA-dependent RNA polymerase [Leptomonas pyrrhocoris ostravirus]